MTILEHIFVLRARLQTVLAAGLAKHPLAHAEQVAEIAGVLHEAFEREGFSATLVGGSAIEIHAPGIYVSGDLDYVIDRIREGTKQVNEIFESLGFGKQGGRHWVLGDLFIEQVASPVAGPTEEVRVGEAVFRIATKEVALRDRVVGFLHWEYTAYGEQALDMLAAFGEELDEGWLFDELRREGSHGRHLTRLGRSTSRAWPEAMIPPDPPPAGPRISGTAPHLNRERHDESTARPAREMG